MREAPFLLLVNMEALVRSYGTRKETLKRWYEYLDCSGEVNFSFK